jgi:hypothetical protein
VKPAALLLLCLSVACAPLPRSAPVGAAIAAGFRSTDDSLMAATLERDGLRVLRGPITLYAPPDALSPTELTALADTLARGYRALRELLAPAHTWHRYDSPRIRIYLGTRPAGALTDAGSRIFFPLAWTDESRTTLLHEMAHVFLMPRRPLAFEAADSLDVHELLRDRAFWFDEGMAEYAAQRVARQIGLPAHDPWNTDYTHGLDGACRLWTAERGSAHAFAHVGASGPPPLRSRVEIGTFYVCSESFVAFLADHIGLSTTLSLGGTDDVAARLAAVTPKTLDQWLDAWHDRIAMTSSVEGS